MKKIVKTSLLFISVGFLLSLVVFFLLFGEGVQFLMPCILFVFFFICFFILEKIPFVRKHPIVKFLLSVLLIVSVIVLI